MDEITKELTTHFSKTFLRHGATTEGVNWGTKTDKIARRYTVFSDFITKNMADKKISVLDVGCGYGALLNYLGNNIENIEYYGIDPCLEMINTAKSTYMKAFYNISLEDLHDKKFENIPIPDKFDYVVCNGVFTLKNDMSNIAINKFVNKSIQYCFNLCKKSVLFNMMSTHVDFFNSNLFYKNPADMITFIIENMTNKVAVDHYLIEYEYFVTMYK